MQQKDYFLKLLQPFSQMLPYLLNLKKNGHYDEALAVIQGTGQQLTGFDAGLLNSLSAQSLLAMLDADSPSGAAQCLALAALFAEQGRIHEARADINEADASYLKALDIYLVVLHDRDTSDYLEEFGSINELVTALNGASLPKSTLHNLFRFYASNGSYARAEDTLFDLIALDAQDSALIDEGIAFYGMLKGKSDAELVAGDLPRDEIEGGLQEWLAL